MFYTPRPPVPPPWAGTTEIFAILAIMIDVITQCAVAGTSTTVVAPPLLSSPRIERLRSIRGRESKIDLVHTFSYSNYIASKLSSH